MEQYAGKLTGGPDHGNHVTASKTRIPVVNTVEMWLDGKSEDATVNIIVVKGSYLWNENDHTFKWQEETISFFSKKPEPV